MLLSNDLLIELCLISLLVLIIIYIVRTYQYKKESFENEDVVNSLMDNIMNSVSEDLKKYSNINLPLILSDEGEVCPDWNKGSKCMKEGTNFICSLIGNPNPTNPTNPTNTTNQPDRYYCNNWVDDSLMNDQIININNIVKQNVDFNKDKILELQNRFKTIREKTTDNINSIKNSNSLVALQQYFIDNNSQNLYNKKLLIDENNTKIDQYNNDITSSYYKYQDNNKKLEKYKKYGFWLNWILYILLFGLVIIIVLNILFSRTDRTIN